MITLSFPWLIALIVLLFFAILVLMACFKSPMRKWICFALSFTSIAYLLYIMLWEQNGTEQKLDWYLLGCVGIFAALVLAGVGFMDLVKPMSISMSAHSSDTIPVSCSEEIKCDTVVDDKEYEEGYNDNEAEEEKKQKEVFIRIVMRWFVDQLKQYSDEEKNAIKICAINFVNEDIITAPDAIIKNNKLYSQNRIIELCSAFYLMGKPKDACVTFVKQVFSESFANTEDSTITKKIIGPDKMMEIISTYQDAQRLDSNGAS